MSTRSRRAPRRVVDIYTTKDVADYVGVTPGAVITAEKRGRLPPARRDELGHRVYDAFDRERIAAVMGRR